MISQYQRTLVKLIDQYYYIQITAHFLRFDLLTFRLIIDSTLLKLCTIDLEYNHLVVTQK